jgi:hypothetical protein
MRTEKITSKKEKWEQQKIITNMVTPKLKKHPKLITLKNDDIKW